MDYGRRRFLQAGLSSLAYFTLEATTPNWIIRSALATQAAGGFPDDRILVIIQLAGGNDGLNTVIPRTDPIYYDASTRPTIRVPAGMELNLDGLNGLHPQLSRLAGWYQQGNLAIVHNVGYQNPNLSHFTSTDYWMYGYTPQDTPKTEGWVARFFDNACAGAPSIDAIKMVVAGQSSLPNALNGSTLFRAPTINSASSYSFTASTDRTLRLNAITALNGQAVVDPELDFLQRSANSTQASISEIGVAAATPILYNQYTSEGIGNGLKLASQVIRAGFGTSIFYVSQGGYDTHAGQVTAAGDVTLGAQPKLLASLDQNVDAFLTEMKMSGNLDRVLLMTFSEFGRRVAENGSKGTDHGTANCLFVAGGKVAGGVLGGQPNLAQLIKGNTEYKIDFRSVYSAVMQQWMEQDAAPVFGQSVYDSIIAADLPKLPLVQIPSAARRAWRGYL